MTQQTWIDANAGWLGVVLGAIGLILAFAIPWWMRRSINLAWQLRAQMPLMTAGNNGSDLTITSTEDQKAERPVLNVVRLGNRGRSEIRSRDYDGPVRISFSADSTLIGAALYDPLSVETTIELVRDGNVVTFTPGLLKKNEWVEVQLMTDGRPEMPKLKARVEGQRAKVLEISERRRDFWFTVQFASGFVWFSFGFLNLLLNDAGRIMGLTVFYVALFVFVFATYRKSKSPRWAREPKMPYHWH